MKRLDLENAFAQAPVACSRCHTCINVTRYTIAVIGYDEE